MGESLEGNIVRVMSVERGKKERKSESSMMRILVWEKLCEKRFALCVFYKIQRRESEKKENKFIWWLFYVTILQYTVLSPMLQRTLLSHGQKSAQCNKKNKNLRHWPVLDPRVAICQ